MSPSRGKWILPLFLAFLPIGCSGSGSADDPGGLADVLGSDLAGIDTTGLDLAGRDAKPPAPDGLVLDGTHADLAADLGPDAVLPQDLPPAEVPLDDLVNPFDTAVPDDEGSPLPDQGPGCDDPDGDGRGPGCGLGADCDPADAFVWASCDTCRDGDGDGWHAGCDAYPFPVGGGVDCDDSDGAVFDFVQGYEDRDGDGWARDDETQAVCSGPTLPAGYKASSLGVDCNDDNAALNETCGAWLVKNLHVLSDDAPGSKPRNFVPYAVMGLGNLLFSAEDGQHGRELWKWYPNGSGGPKLVVDLVPGPVGVSFGTVKTGSGGAWMVIDDGIHGSELWFTRGSATSTVLLKDICAGAGGSNPTEMTRFGTKLLFVADECNGKTPGLWISDGTAAGTKLVTRPKYTGYDETFTPKWITIAGSYAYFAVPYQKVWQSFLLFRTDGTAAGTVPVYDAGDTPKAYNRFETWGLTAVGNRLVALMEISDPDPGKGDAYLFSTGGPGDHLLLDDVHEPALQSGAQRIPMVGLGSKVFFLADTPPPRSWEEGIGTELWVSDLTPDTARMVKDINQVGDSVLIDEFLPFGSSVYFRAQDDGSGEEVYRSDGTEAGTVQVKDVWPGANPSKPRALTRLGNYLYFVAEDGTHGRELWRSTGSPSGTAMVKDIGEGSAWAGITALTPIEDTLVFNANGDRTGYEQGDELWIHDPSAAAGQQTRLLADLHHVNVSSNPQPLLVDGDRLLFSADDRPSGDTAHGREPWLTDGTEAGTRRLKDINSGGKGSDPAGFVRLGDAWLFTASDGIGGGQHGRELWRTDLTEAGTSLVKDIRSGIGSSNPNQIVVLNDVAYFVADDGSSGNELWKTDGTGPGTVRVEDIRPGATGSEPSQLVVFNGKIYFTANDGTTGVELWFSDGTEAGTTRVKDINAGSASSTPNQLVVWQGDLYFAATRDADGTELWKSGGTTADTVPVQDIFPGASSSFPAQLVPTLNYLVFTADDGTTGQELWRTTGAPGGTVRIKDIQSGKTGSAPTGLVKMGDFYYFAATTSSGGTELYRTDLDTPGTTRVKDLVAGTGSSGPTMLTVLGDLLFFVATTPSGGLELYRSDGTDAGTFLLKDICEGACDATPTGLFPTADGVTLLFGAYDKAQGIELWATDGTTAGTRRVVDLSPGPARSSPENFAQAGSRVFFTADTHELGRELWAIEQGDL